LLTFFISFSFASPSLNHLFIVTVTVKARTVTVKGPLGTLERAFKGNSFAAVVQTGEDGKPVLKVDMWFGNKKQLATLRTITTHIQNMIAGVTKGFQYKMRFAYSHFPINVTLSKGEGKSKEVAGKVLKDQHFVEIRNFLGQSRLRKVQLHDGVTVTRSAAVKDEITLEGTSLEKVAGSAASVHESCLIRHKDIRKFLDGLYVSERGIKGATVQLM
jgi:large subunit ribosomal protein L9e